MIFKKYYYNISSIIIKRFKPSLTAEFYKLWQKTALHTVANGFHLLTAFWYMLILYDQNGY